MKKEQASNLAKMLRVRGVWAFPAARPAYEDSDSWGVNLGEEFPCIIYDASILERMIEEREPVENYLSGW